VTFENGGISRSTTFSRNRFVDMVGNLARLENRSKLIRFVTFFRSSDVNTKFISKLQYSKRSTILYLTMFAVFII